MLLEDLALIGNCQFSALVSNRGEICWACLPRFASEPAGAMLSPAPTPFMICTLPASREVLDPKNRC